MLIDFDSLYYEYSSRKKTWNEEKIGLGCEMREKKFLL